MGTETNLEDLASNPHSTMKMGDVGPGTDSQPNQPQRVERRNTYTTLSSLGERVL